MADKVGYNKKVTIMHGIETSQILNAEAAIKGIIRRAAERGVTLTRDEVLEDMAYSQDEDTTVWAATVDRLLELGH